MSLTGPRIAGSASSWAAGLAGVLALLGFGAAFSAAGQESQGASLGQARDGYWSADGERLLFVSDRAGTFQLYEMSLEGGPARRLTDNTVPFFYPSYSPDGSKIVLMSYEDDTRAAVWTLSSDGTDLRRLTEEDGFNSDPNWTSDGRGIVFHHRSSADDAIYVMNADGSGFRPLIRHEASEYTPVPSPDGAHIAVVSERGGAADIWLFDADGTNPRNLTRDPEWNGVPRWTADSASVVYYSNLFVPDDSRPSGRRTVGSDLFQVDVESGRKTRLTETGIRESGPNISPDGKRVCFTAMEPDGKQLWVMNLDGTGRRRLTGGS